MTVCYYLITGLRETLGQPFVFYEMTFADGPITDRSTNSDSRLYIQEGAIVEISCKTPNARWSYNVLSNYDYYGVWLLNYDDSRSTTTRVDSDIFEITDNWEQYHSTGVSSELVKHIVFVSKLRYTGRLEDNGKYLQCKTAKGAVAILSVGQEALVILVVRREFQHTLM